MKFDFKKYLPELIIIAAFAVISILNALPAYQGMELTQGDHESWKAMAQEAKSFHEKTGENTLWSNSMFGGMPTYTTYVAHSDAYLTHLHWNALATWLNKPANFFFIGMLSFFILASVLRINKWLGLVGSVAFALTSFSVISIVAGHETKIWCLNYMPAVFAGFIMIFRGKWVAGLAVFTLSFSMMLTNGHWQIIYYAGFALIALGIGFFIKSIMDKSLSRFLIAGVIALAGAGISMATIAVNLMPISEYNKVTMRGGRSELTLNKTKEELAQNGGLKKDYAFQWSNSGGEVFTMLVPYLYGGGDAEPADHAPETAGEFGIERVPLYWGPQPFLAGPMNYVTAIMCFLFVLGLLVIRNRLKWIFAAMAFVAILMSMGDHFKAFNYFLFDHLPMFKSFRTPTMIHAVSAVIFPLIGIWGLSELLKEADKQKFMKALLTSAGITAGLALLLGVGSGMFFDFTSTADQGRLAGMGADKETLARLLSALKKDRADIAMKSGLTSCAYILAAAGLIWIYIKGIVKEPLVMIGGIGILVLIDLVTINSNYITRENNYTEITADGDTAPPVREVDKPILADKDPYFRVLDVSRDIYNDAMQAYYHKSIGGYSPAKMEIYQDMIDMQMGGKQSGGKFNEQVLNMLNTKYVIAGRPGQEGIVPGITHPCGNGWFVNEVKFYHTADEDMRALNANGLGDSAKATDFNPMTTANLRDTLKSQFSGYTFGKDSSSKITLTQYGLNTLSYTSHNAQNGFAVFSDIYYPYGWRAYVDGAETPILKTNYLLRGIKVPAGDHKIEFKFHPDTWYTGNKISQVGSIIAILVILGAVVLVLRKSNSKEAEA